MLVLLSCLQRQLPQEQPEQGAAGGHCAGAAEEGEGAAAEAPAAPGQAAGPGDHRGPAAADQPGQRGEAAALGYTVHTHTHTSDLGCFRSGLMVFQ